MIASRAQFPDLPPLENVPDDRFFERLAALLNEEEQACVFMALLLYPAPRQPTSGPMDTPENLEALSWRVRAADALFHQPPRIKSAHKHVDRVAEQVARLVRAFLADPSDRLSTDRERRFRDTLERASSRATGKVHLPVRGEVRSDGSVRWTSPIVGA